jgi:PKD repeat protein
MKWKTNVGAGTSPTIGKNGVIYAGYSHLYAINPINGSMEWIFNPGQGRTIEGGTPCNSADGTIYFGTSDGGEIIAVNSNGSEKWRKNIGPSVNSPPAIGKDGSIYVGSDWTVVDSYLHAFGIGPLRAEANGPYNGFSYESLQFIGSIYGGIPPYQYHWDFGDGQTSNKQNPTHNYTTIGNYTATFTVIDSQGNSSNDTAQVTITHMPPSISITKPDNSLYILNIRIIPFPHPLIIGPITIKVTASQEPLGIDRVEFLIDGKLQATDFTVPFKWIWYTPSFSRHTITATAYDTSGKSASASIDVWKFL